MIPIKRRCSFFESCHFADATSKTCTVDGGGEYCGCCRTMLKLQKEKKKELLLISDFDEWYGPIYTCPFCTEEKLMDDFNFCPNCGADLNGLKFESIADEQKRMEKERWMKK